LTELAHRAGMTPQSMAEIVDELVELGYVVRRPDPADRRAKLVVLTRRGRDAVAAGRRTIEGLEDRVTEVLGERGHRDLRRLLGKLLDAETP
jgi:DNA-binding MarR family transcriptional regulator